MKPDVLRASAFAVLAGVTALAGVEEQDPAEAAGRGETARLEARVAELEAALARVKAQRERLAASAARGGAAPGEAVRTARFAELGRTTPAGTTAPETIARLFGHLDRFDGAELARELETHFTAGAEGYAVLRDFLDSLEADPQRKFLLLGKYQVAFGVVHLPLLHESEFAGFAHYYLAASRDAKGSRMRQELISYLPVLLEYRPGRYPDLEEALRQHIASELEKPGADLQALFLAAKSLRYRPPFAVVERLLLDSRTLQHTTILVDHLVWRDDADAVRLLSRFARERLDEGVTGYQALAGLARMVEPSADRALRQFLRVGDPDLIGMVYRAYFSVRRDETHAPLLLRYLNAPVPVEEKRRFVAELKQKNIDVMAGLLQHAGSILSNEVRDLVTR